MKAVVVGAGIGGLAAALALSRAGWAVEVLEQAAEISEVGAGLQISPNGVRVLEELGVMDLLEPTLFEPEAISLRIGASGRKVFELPMKDVAAGRWGARYIQNHRADLQDALKTALGKQAGPVIRTHAKATGYVRERGGAAVYLERGDRVFGDLIVAADGIRSVLRNQMHGADRVRFTGNVAWRTVVPADRLGDLAPPPQGCVWAGPGKHAVTTYLRGGSLVNFVGIVEEDGWTEEGWSIPGERKDALAEFGGWNPTLTAILEQTDRLNRWALCDRPPLVSWSDGPVTLLGDAAHPMLPSMAQGAVQALEDATILAQCLTDETDVGKGLQQYFDLRIERVTRIQQRSRDNLMLFHKRGWMRQALSYSPIWAAAKLSPNLIHRRQDWIYNYDATTAVKRP